MLKTRVITATALLLGLLLALFFLPPLLWTSFCAVICAFMAWEWGGLAGFGKQARVIYGIALGCLCFFVVAFHQLSLASWSFVLIAGVVTAASAFWLLAAPFWLWRKWSLSARPWGAALLGIIVLVPPMFVFIALREFGPWIVWIVCAQVWIADVAAYFFGRVFGGKKLAPSISPGKTWSGAIGGVIGALVYCNAVFVIPFFWADAQNEPMWGALAAELNGVPAWLILLMLQLLFIGLAVLSIIGDLFESLLKRQAGMKDSSNLLPGHGGVLDRVDSLTSVLSLVGFVFALYACFLPGS